MNEDRRQHIAQVIRLRRRAALSTARAYARELRLERFDGHANRSAIDAHYVEMVAAYRQDASDLLGDLRKLHLPRTEKK